MKSLQRRRTAYVTRIKLIRMRVHNENKWVISAAVGLVYINAAKNQLIKYSMVHGPHIHRISLRLSNNSLKYCVCREISVVDLQSIYNTIQCMIYTAPVAPRCHRGAGGHLVTISRKQKRTAKFQVCQRVTVQMLADSSEEMALYCSAEGIVCHLFPSITIAE